MKNTIFGLIVLLATSTQGFAMSLFDFAKVCLFSEVNGQVLLKGKPITDATIKQTYYWGHKPISRTTQVDQFGKFHFNPVYKYYLGQFFPIEAVVSQEISIIHDGKEFEGWISTKRSFDENSELNGKSIDLTCDLTDENSSKEVGYEIVLGICRWK